MNPRAITRDLASEAVVVGSGPAGCVVARRLAERGRTVLLLEAGGTAAPGTAGIMDIGPRSRVTRRWPALLDGEPVTLPRGRCPGGSGAVNGGYCLPARPTDLAAWPGDWSLRYRAGLARASASLRPRVVRPDPVAARMSRTWPGATTRVLQIRSGSARRGPLQAWDPPGAGARLATGAQVTELTWSDNPGGRCTGVLLADGRHVAATEVWLAAGTLGTAEILVASGIGPGTGHPVGIRLDEHPEVLLDIPGHWSPWAEATVSPPPPLLTAVTRLELGGRLIEVRPYSVPFHLVIPGAPPQPQRIGVALMDPAGGGALRVDRGGGVRALTVDLDAFPDPGDRIALDLAVDHVRDRLAADGEVHRSTSQHLSGSARMGEVVDGDGRLLGASGLRIADGSVLPALPSWGPFLTIAAVAEALVRAL